MNAPVKARSALETLDRAIEIARSQPLPEFLRACLPGGLIAWSVLTLFYLERVEGIRFLRPVFAVVLVALFALRAVLLGRWAGRRAHDDLAPSGVTPELARPALMVRASLWVAFELWFWLWPVVVMLHVDPWLMPLLLPLWCVRAAIVPSWLSVINESSERTGFQAMKAALFHCDGQRGQAATCELFLLLGTLAVMINLGAALMLFVTLAQTSLGLDLSTVRAFVSPQNHFVLLCVAALALVVLEPVRASLSSVLYVDAELVRGGAGVRALVARAVTQKRGPGALPLGLCALFALLPAAPSHGQDQASALSTDAPAVEESCDESCSKAQERDAELEERVLEILGEPEFAEFPDEAWTIDGKGALRRWLERLFDAWFKQASDPSKPPRPPGWSMGDLPGTKFFLTIAVLLLMAALAKLAFGGAPRRTSRGHPGPATKAEDPFSRAADDHFADALRLFADRPRDALRALYLGALVGLARQSLLQLAPERSNGHYLRQLAGRTQRAPFGELTRAFDAVQYGDLQLDRAGFQRCLELARGLVQSGTEGEHQGKGAA